MSFWVNRLLVCLCLIQGTGCVIILSPPPEESNLETHDEVPLPNLTLVRDVVPEVGKEYRKRHPLFSSDYFGSVVSESRFGDPGEEADLSCIYTGLKEALPSIDILSTSAFWERVGAPNNVIELSELFVAPQSEWLREFQADILVIAYHTRIDLENTKMEVLIEGAYDDTDKETASIIVIDLHRKTIIHGLKVTFEDKAFFYHFMIIPVFWFHTTDPPDMCIAVARQAGIAIAETMPDRPIRALVVVAGEEPMRQEFDKKRQEIEEERRRAENRKHAEKVAQELAKLELEATKGNTDAQLNLFKEIYSEDPNRALRWLCKSADLGNEEARSIMAKVYEYGGYIWIKKGDIQQNYKLAYVWYALPGIYDEEDLQFFADRHLTTAELSDANNLLREWQPGQCEKDLGLVSYTE